MLPSERVIPPASVKDVVVDTEGVAVIALAGDSIHSTGKPLPVLSA